MVYLFQRYKGASIDLKELADGVRYFKETGEGRENMCDSVKQYAKEMADEKNKKIKAK